MNRKEQLLVRATKIVALVEAGETYREIGRICDISVSVVNRTWHRYLETGSVSRREGSGRPRKTTSREDRAIARYATKNRTSSAQEIRSNVPIQNQTSKQLILNRLKAYRLRSRRPVRVPYLTDNHRRQRRNYALQYGNWTQRDWCKVLFSDESRFNLYASDGRCRVWRSLGERLHPNCVMPVVAFHGGSVMVWAGISWNCKTDLVVIPHPALTLARYVEEILRLHMLSMKRQIGRGFFFMHDNARPHTALNTRQFLQQHRINLISHPPRSPDLNPIEHVWDMLQRRVRKRTRQPTNLQELQDALQEEWQQITMQQIRNVLNMPRRIYEVMRARGGNTRY